MIVDSHHHFLDPSRYVYPWLDKRLARIDRVFEPRQLEPLLRPTGVGSTVAVQTLHDEGETLDLLTTSETFPWIAGVVGWVDLTRDDIAERIQRLIEAPGGTRLRGFRHLVHNEESAGWLDRDDVRRGLRVVADFGLTFDLLVRTRELSAALDTVRAVPELRFVVDHIAKPRIADGWPHPEWAVAIAALASEANVQCKLSGLVTEDDWNAWSVAHMRPFVAYVLECFGARRLMFGSDWPVCELAASYEVVLETAHALTDELSPADQSAVFAQTAASFYRLPVTAEART